MKPQASNASARLRLYAAAAGAVGVAAGPANAAVQPFTPPGGLPITIDSVNSQMDIDLDGDTVADFRIFYMTSYGGGFSIAGLTPGDADNGIETHAANDGNNASFDFWFPVRRYDPTEWISENQDFDDGNSGNPDSGGNVVLGHRVGAAYKPFVNRPGFVNLRLQADSTTRGPGLPPRPGFLEVVISPDFQTLRILSGGYEDQTNIDAFELPELTPPPAP